jgi:acyl carrier protein
MSTIDPKQFCENWAEAVEGLEPDMLQFDTPFKQLPVWDSLMLLLTVAMVESEYSVVLRGTDFDNCKTVADLIRHIESQACA